MKKLIPYILLFLLPLALIIISVFYKSSIGEFYLGGYYDPSYPYLINSLNLAQLNGFGTGILEHPGIPVQIIGAVVIRLLYMIQNVKSDIVHDVLSRPEYYLMKINLVLVFMNAFALFILGLTAYKKLNNVNASLFLQLSPFSFSIIYFKLTDFCPESLIIFSVLLFIAVTISITNEKEMTKKKLLKYAVLFGIICGFGLTCKILFFPLLIIPILLINHFSFKALFLLITFLSFSVIFFSAASVDNFLFFLNWLFNLMTHSGRYGQGEKKFIDPSQVYGNLKLVFDRAPLFVISYTLIILCFILSFLKQFKLKMRSNKYFPLFIGLFLTMTFQILIVLKQFYRHYMISVYILSVLGLFVVCSLFYDFSPNFFKKYKNIFLILILLVFSYYNYLVIRIDNTYYSKRKNQSLEAMKYLDEHYDKSLIVGTIGASNIVPPLYYGVRLSGNQQINYFPILLESFPNYIIYSSWEDKKFQSFDPGDDIKTKLLNSPKIIFICDNQNILKEFLENVKQSTNQPNTSYKNVYLNKRGEAIYEVYLDSTK